MGAKLNEIFSAKTINDFYKNQKSTKKDIGKAPANLLHKLTGIIYKDNYDLKVLKNDVEYTPQMIQASAFDADPKIRGFETTVTMVKDKPFFREAMKFNEKDRKDILTFIKNSPSEEELARITLQYYKQIANFVAGVDARHTMILGQFLQAGVVKVEDNGGGYILDYGLDASQKETLSGTATWDKTSAKPLDDLVKWKEVVELKGGVVEIALMTRKTYNMLLNHETVKNAMTGGVAGRVILPSEKEAFIEAYTGLKVVLFEDVVRINETKKVKVFSDKVVTLIPNRQIGNFEYSPTPAQIDKSLDVLGSDVELVEIDGTFASLTVQPVKSDTGISNLDIQVASCSMFNPTILDEMFIATVIE